MIEGEVPDGWIHTSYITSRETLSIARLVSLGHAQEFEDDPGAALLEPLDFVEVGDEFSSIDDEVPEKRAWGDWAVRFGAIVFDRSNPPSQCVSDYLCYTERTINAGDLNLLSAGAIDLSIRQAAPWADIDFRYFGVSRATADTGPLTGTHSETYYYVVESSVYGRFGLDLGRPNPLTAPPVPPAVYAPSPQLYAFVVETPYESRAAVVSWLQSFELNLRREVYPNVALLAGFRYVEFNEQWMLRQYAPEELIGIDSFTRNSLFGFQIGSEALLFSLNRFKLESALKAGIYGNAASGVETTIAQTNQFSFWYSRDALRGAVAFVGDINVSAAWQLTRNMSIRGGYQLLWLAGVATATDQLRQFDESTFATNTAGSVFFHGAMVGLEYGW